MKHELKDLEISLIGDFSFYAETAIELLYENTPLYIKDRHSLFKISEKIKGSSLDRLILILQDYRIGNNFTQILKDKSRTEISLFKSLFLLYHWVELPLTNPSELNLENQIYDNFIVDYTSNVGPQEDIYFIKKEHLKESNFKLIQRLIELNLLVKGEITTKDEKEFEIYFTALLKPGVPFEFFKTEFDKSGVNTYSLWKNIISDRDSRFKRWINNRF